MFNFLSLFAKPKIQTLFAIVFLALFATNFYNLKGWQDANKKIADQNQKIKTKDEKINSLNEKIKGLDAIAHYERAQTIAAFDNKTIECAASIKQAVAAANVPPREKIIFKPIQKTQFITKEIVNETQCPNNVPDIVATDAYSLRDIQTAGANN